MWEVGLSGPELARVLQAQDLGFRSAGGEGVPALGAVGGPAERAPGAGPQQGEQS